MSTAKKGKAYPKEDMTVLMQFADECPIGYNPYIGNGFVRYNTCVAKTVAAFIGKWAIQNNFNITATPQNNSVIVEIAPNKLDGVNERIDKLKDILR